MNVRGAASLGLILTGTLAASLTFAATPAKTPATPAKSTSAASAKTASAPPVMAGRPGSVEHAPFLPDSFVLCTVGPRRTTVLDFRTMWFAAYVPDRPDNDSSGRVTFLDNIVTKDILGQVAREVNRPFGFEDRARLREIEERTLANALYQSAVVESLQVSDADIAREYETYQNELLLRHIVFADEPTAVRVRLALIGGLTTWKQAYDRYSLSKDTDKKPYGELGWVVRGGVPLEMSRKIFRLNRGSYSEPYLDDAGWTVVQVVDKRPGTPPSMAAVADFIRSQLSSEQVYERSVAVRKLVAGQVGMTYDSTNINFAAQFFTPARTMVRDEKGVTNVALDTNVPEFQPQDTSRVLARHRYGVMTLGRFLHMYSDIQPLTRPNVNYPEALKNQVDAFLLEPYMAQVARDRGLDKRPEVVKDIEKMREQIMVEHLFADSVQSRVAIAPEARKKYYRDHANDFTTYNQVRFAALWADSKEKADQYAARLKSGEKAEDILHADSLLGVNRGSIQVRSQNDHGPYQKLLMEELRPGQVTVEGPDKKGDYAILQSIEYIPGHLLSYDEASGYIDESLQNIESERMLKAFVERHRSKFPITTHPDVVMRIHLVEPGI